MPRLGKDTYKRPKFTLTDRLDEDDIKAKLVGYKRIKNVKALEKIPNGTHVRYFRDYDGEYQFRTGGMLINKKNIDKFVVLSNNGKTWCADTKLCIFFAKKSNTEIKEKYKETIKKQSEKISELKEKIKENVVTYKNMEGKLTDPYKLKIKDFVIIANKRRKRIYEKMSIYNIYKIKNKIINIKAMDADFEDYTFNTDDYYFYKIRPSKNDPLREAQKRMIVIAN
jgi:hypothetical protein